MQLNRWIVWSVIKVLNVQVPLFFKDIIDALNVEINSDTTVWVLVGSLILGCRSIIFSFTTSVSRAYLPLP